MRRGDFGPRRKRVSPQHVFLIFVLLLPPVAPFSDISREPFYLTINPRCIVMRLSQALGNDAPDWALSMLLLHRSSRLVYWLRFEGCSYRIRSEILVQL